jgi:hypothetical protein
LVNSERTYLLRKNGASLFFKDVSSSGSYLEKLEKNGAATESGEIRF